MLLWCFNDDAAARRCSQAFVFLFEIKFVPPICHNSQSQTTYLSYDLSVSAASHGLHHVFFSLYILFYCFSFVVMFEV